MLNTNLPGLTSEDVVSKDPIGMFFQLMYNLCITSFWCDHSQDKKFIDRARIQYLSLHDVYYYKNHPLTSQCVSREVTRTNTGGVRLI